MRRAIASVALFLLLACAGQQAREHVLIPALRQSFPAVRSAIERGAPGDSAVAARVAQVDAALAAGSVAGVMWSPLEPVAQAGIRARVQSGEISEGVAGSLLEEVSLFGAGMRKAGGL